MFIKNRKYYLISLLISGVGTILFWICSLFFSNSVVDIIATIILIIADVAGIACGSLGVYVSLVKASFRRSSIIALSLPLIIIFFMLKLILIAWVIGLGLLFCLVFPGVYALIAWFQHRDELLEK